jgi:hypothetical protein
MTCGGRNGQKAQDRTLSATDDVYVVFCKHGLNLCTASLFLNLTTSSLKAVYRLCCFHICNGLDALFGSLRAEYYFAPHRTRRACPHVRTSPARTTFAIHAQGDVKLLCRSPRTAIPVAFSIRVRSRPCTTIPVHMSGDVKLRYMLSQCPFQAPSIPGLCCFNLAD